MAVIKFNGKVLKLDENIPNHKKIKINAESLIDNRLYNLINGDYFTINSGNFVKINDYLQCNNGRASYISDINFGKKQTILLSFKQGIISTSNILCTANNDFLIRIYSSTGFYLLLNGLSYLFNFNNYLANSIIIVRDNSNYKIYVDGKYFENYIVPQHDNIDFIFRSIGNQICTCQIDEIIIEERLWTDDEIKKYYYNRNGLSESKLQRLNDIGNLIHSSAQIISDSSHIYAHESQILIHRTNAYKLLKIITYSANSNAVNEGGDGLHCILKIYDKKSGELLFNQKIIEGNHDYGNGIVTAQGTAWCSRMYIYGTVLHLILLCEKVIYHRTVNLETLSISNMDYFYVTIFGGSNPVILNSQAMVNHLEAITGSTSDIFQGTIIIRSNDQIQIVNTRWYLVAEVMNFPNGNNAAIPMLMYSDDSGTNWILSTPIFMPESYPYGFCEVTITYFNNKFIALTRRADIDKLSYWQIESQDGVIWGEPFLSNIQGIGTRHSIVTTMDNKGNRVAYICHNKKHFAFQSNRCLMAIAKTYDFNTFEDIIIINHPQSLHYPSITEKYGTLYFTYTSGISGNTLDDKDTIYSAEYIIPEYL